jgi:basic membrane protein A
MAFWPEADLIQFHPTRRHLVVAAAMLAAGTARAQAKPRIAALFAGRIDDGGFMEAGHRGLIAAREQLGCAVSFTDRIAPQTAALQAALRALAQDGPDLVVAHGGQNNEAARLVAAEFPAVRFVVTQGNVVGANLASYEVLQEQSAFLAGALAGLRTASGVVGHMSGIRVAPGLKGRAAFANGLAATHPAARLLSNFSGNQDDNALSARVASAMLDAGADVLFTMLNAGRTGAIGVCRARHVPQIGNVRDWVASDPDVFIASAIADSGLAVFNAVADLVAGRLPVGALRSIGLEQPDAVRLAMAASVAVAHRELVAALGSEIVTGRLKVSTEWAGVEFATPR